MQIFWGFSSIFLIHGLTGIISLAIICLEDCDTLTGDFGGEIRLAYHFDGKTVIPVTGVSISGNIKNLHKEMYLSSEIQQANNFRDPKTIKVLNVSVTGVK